MLKESIKNLIKKAYEETTELNEDRIELQEETVFIGPNGVLDSVNFVQFLVTLEELVMQEHQKSITIADEKAFSLKVSPFSSPDRLAQFVSEKVEATS